MTNLKCNFQHKHFIFFSKLTDDHRRSSRDEFGPGSGRGGGTDQALHNIPRGPAEGVGAASPSQPLPPPRRQALAPAALREIQGEGERGGEGRSPLDRDRQEGESLQGIPHRVFPPGPFHPAHGSLRRPHLLRVPQDHPAECPAPLLPGEADDAAAEEENAPVEGPLAESSRHLQERARGYTRGAAVYYV